jgi:hypothetical protein
MPPRPLAVAALLSSLALGCGDPDGTLARSVPGAEREPFYDHPGEAASSLVVEGRGACAGRTAGDALARLAEGRPDLRALPTLAASQPAPPDQPRTYAFVRPDGGFAIAVRRAPEGCALPCAESEHLYFETDAACALKPAGRFVRRRTGTCSEVEGEARWDLPTPPASVEICGADLTPAPVERREIPLASRGFSRPCRGPGKAVFGRATATIEPVHGAHEHAHVLVEGTGLGRLDDILHTGKIEGRRITVGLGFTLSEGTCKKEVRGSLTLDLDRPLVLGALTLEESWTGCGEACEAKTELALRARR